MVNKSVEDFRNALEKELRILEREIFLLNRVTQSRNNLISSKGDSNKVHAKVNVGGLRRLV